MRSEKEKLAIQNKFDLYPLRHGHLVDLLIEDSRKKSN